MDQRGVGVAQERYSTLPTKSQPFPLSIALVKSTKLSEHCQHIGCVPACVLELCAHTLGPCPHFGSDPGSDALAFGRTCSPSPILLLGICALCQPELWSALAGPPSNLYLHVYLTSPGGGHYKLVVASKANDCPTGHILLWSGSASSASVHPSPSHLSSSTGFGAESLASNLVALA